MFYPADRSMHRHAYRCSASATIARRALKGTTILRPIRADGNSFRATSSVECRVAGSNFGASYRAHFVVERSASPCRCISQQRLRRRRPADLLRSNRCDEASDHPVGHRRNSCVGIDCLVAKSAMVQARRRKDVPAVTSDVDAGAEAAAGVVRHCLTGMREVRVHAVARAHREGRRQSPIAVNEI